MENTLSLYLVSLFVSVLICVLQFLILGKIRRSKILETDHLPAENLLALCYILALQNFIIKICLILSFLCKHNFRMCTSQFGQLVLTMETYN